MLFAFIHELGHMLTGILLKLKPKSISLMPFGVRLTFETYEYKKLVEIKKILIAIAGPLTNLIIFTITMFLHIDPNIKNLICYSNILIAIFNLIPLYPLDGGRFLKGVIRLKMNEMEADEITNKISNILIVLLTAISSILILYLKNVAVIFIITYLWIIVLNENKKYNLKKRAYKILQNTSVHIDI